MSHFERLRTKYGVRGFPDGSPTSPLYRILLVLEDAKELARDDIRWLETQNLHSVLALHFERLYAQTADLGKAASASAHWRKAGHPERALALTQKHAVGNPKAIAAFLTSRAGALADVGALADAEKIALQADGGRQDDPMTLKCLGRITYLRGELKRSQDYFETAERLGSTSAETDRIRRAEMGKLPMDQRARTAAFLLARDPVRYAWAVNYIPRNG